MFGGQFFWGGILQKSIGEVQRQYKTNNIGKLFDCERDISNKYKKKACRL